MVRGGLLREQEHEVFRIQLFEGGGVLIILVAGCRLQVAGIGKGESIHNWLIF